MRFIFLFFFFNFFISTYAEVIKFKNNKTIEAQIIEKTDQYIKVNISGAPVKYYLSDIESIDNKDIFFKENLDTNLFKDEKFGFKFTYPKGWEIVPKIDKNQDNIVELRPIREKSPILGFRVVLIPKEKIKKDLRWDDLSGYFKLEDNFKVDSKDIIKINGKDFYFLRYKREFIDPKKIDSNKNFIIEVVNVIEFYSFSPLFLDEKDNRLFIINLFYSIPKLKIEKDSLDSNAKEQLEDINKKLKDMDADFKYRYKEAKDIINSFDYFLRSKIEEFKESKDSLDVLQKINEYLSKGLEYYKNNKYNEAITEFEKILQLKSDYLEAYIYIGELYFQLEKFPEALEYLNKALEIRKDDARIYTLIGNIYKTMGQNEDALNYYRKAIGFDPTNLLPYINIGIIYNEERRFAEAVSSFKKALEIDPNNFYANYGIGYSYIFLGDYKNAKTHLLKAKSVIPKENKKEEYILDELIAKIP